MSKYYLVKVFEFLGRKIRSGENELGSRKISK